MTIVIIGSKERNSPEDKAQVESLIERLAEDYPNCLFVTMLTHTGIGRFVKDKCLEKGPNGHFKYQLIVIDFRMYARGLSQSELTQIYKARNASPFELLDILIYFADYTRKGTMEDLIQRAQQNGRPYRVLLPGEQLTLPIF